jgi:hypothetical protein
MTLEMGEADTRIVSVHPRIGDIDAQEWDACANPDPVQFNPFVAHAFLKALEDAGTVGQGSGWLPHHLTIDNGDGWIGAAMPLYAKTHSQGEYVFDHSWAEAFIAPAETITPSCSARFRSHLCRVRAFL